MDFKITPGEYSKITIYESSEVSVFGIRANLGDGTSVAIAEVYGLTKEEAIANANAIAALPELLKALAEAEQLLREKARFDRSADPEFFRLADECRAALKLARDGREEV